MINALLLLEKMETEYDVSRLFVVKLFGPFPVITMF